MFHVGLKKSVDDQLMLVGKDAPHGACLDGNHAAFNGSNRYSLVNLLALLSVPLELTDEAAKIDFDEVRHTPR